MKTERKPRKVRKPHYWYLRYVGECPVCGRDAGYRVRMEGHRPKEAPKVVRLNDEQCYDQCEER